MCVMVSTVLLGLAAAVCSAPSLAALNVSITVPQPTYPLTINPGDTTLFRISLINSNAAAAINSVTFIDNMPSTLTIAGLFSYSCTDGAGDPAAAAGTLVANIGSSSITLTGGVVPAALSGSSGSNGQCVIDVPVTSTAAGTAPTNTIVAGAVTGNDGAAVFNSTPAIQSISVSTLNAPTISKAFSLSPVVKSDQPTKLSIVISNAGNPGVNLPLNGAGNTPAYAIQDVLPPGLQVAATPNAGAVCSGAGVAPAFAPAAGATTLTAVGGTVAGGGTCTLSVDVIGTTTNGNYNNDVVNTIDRSSGFGNQRALVPPADATALLSIRSPLQVAKQFNPGTVSAGQSASLVITLTNASPSRAITLTTFTDSPIDGAGAATGLRVGTPTTTCGGAVTATAGNLGVQLTGGAIGINSNCTITVPFTGSLAVAGTPQTFVNTIAQGGVGTTDASIVSQPATASVTVVDQLLVGKRSAPNNVAPGNPIRYTIDVNNYSSTPLNNVDVPDALPAGMIGLLNPAPTLTGGCGALTHDIPTLPATNGSLHFRIPTLPAGSGPAPATCVIEFWAMAPKNAVPGTTLTNSLPLHTVGSGGVVSSNVATTNTDVDRTITISKVFNPGSAFEGTVSVLTFTLTNLSAQPVTNSSFTDTLPIGDTGQQLMVANPADASTSCAGGVVTAVPGSNLVTLTGATIPARAGGGLNGQGSCQVLVKIIGAAGNYVNQLPIGVLSGTQQFADNSAPVSVSNTTAFSASMNYLSALQSSKSFAPTTINAGGKSTVRLHFANIGNGTLNNVSATDPLPVNMTIATTPNAYSTCNGTPLITAVAAAGTASISGIVLPPNGQCDMLFDVTGTGGAAWTNTIPAGNVSATGGVINTAAFGATLGNSSAGAVSVTVSAVSATTMTSSLSPGEPAVLTIVVRNDGSLALSELKLTNYFTDDGLATGVLSGIQLASTPVLATTCQGGLVTANAAGTAITLSNANLAGGAGTTCNITANVTLLRTGTVQDRIPVGAITNSQGVSNTTAAVTSLSSSGTVGVIKSFTPPVVKPGDRARLRLSIVNAASVPLINIAVTDNLPAGMVVPAGANPTTTCTGATTAAPTAGTVTISGGSLPIASGSAPVSCYGEIDVLAATLGAYPNVVAIGGATGNSGGPVQNGVPATATLEVKNPVVIAKVFAPAQVSPGASSAVTITLTNSNSTALTAAAFIDNLPANVVVAQTPNASTTCAGGFVRAAISATAITLSGATIPANGSCVVKVDVLSNIAGLYTNVIPAGSLSTAQGVTNDNPASATLTLLDPPTVNKQFNPVSIASNGTSTLSIVLGNTNAIAVTLTADLVDTLPVLPDNIVIKTPNNLGGTCTTARVTANAGSGSVTYGNGSTIPAGGCTITVDVTGATSGAYNNFIAAAALKTSGGNNLQPATANLSISTLGSISGKVFKDNKLTPNGIYAGATDVPLATVALTLSGTSYGANGVAGGGDDIAVSMTTTSDALGNYSFTGLAAGSYSVTEPTQPSGTINGITTAGTISGAGGGTAGIPTALASTPSRIANIILLRDAGGQVSISPNNNFAEVVLSSISGVVFLDQNNNGVQNAADTALSGVTIELQNSGGAVIATTTTDAAGAYSFTSLASGVYSVREPTQPADTASGLTIAGSVAGGTAGTPTVPTTVPSRIANISLPPGVASSGNNFAEIPSGRQVSGRVFADADNDGIFNNADTGLAGVTLNLTGADSNGNPVVRATTTNADGSYAFNGLSEGTYIVTEPVQPARTTSGITTAGSSGGAATAVGTVPSVISAINLTGANTSSGDNNFGEIPILVGVVSGKVYIDTNGNGVVDAGESGIAAVIVKLTGADTHGAAVSLSTTTAADGSYSFANLQPSDATGYTITEIQPSLYADGKTTIASGNPGVLGSTKPVLTSNIDVIRSVKIVAGDVFANYNFGEGNAPTLRPLVVNGYVYVDRDHTRTRPDDGTAAGLGGWTVQLKQGGTVICTVATNGSGFYQFDNLHCPGYEVSGLPTGAGFEISFTRDGSALPQSPTSGGGRGTPLNNGKITGITLAVTDQVIEQNLPLDPSGVVYNSQTRQPIAGAAVSISGPAGFDPATQLVGGSATQTTGADGFYQFLLQNAFPSGVYTLSVTAPGGYLPAPSASLPACTGTATVGAAPSPALVQASNLAPASSVPVANPATCVGIVAGGAATSQYYFSFVITNGVSADILNNHIPLDQVNGDIITVIKTSPMINVSRGDLVPYTITATNNQAYAVPSVKIQDQIPAGFKYRSGSAMLNGVKAEPTVSARSLSWANLSFAPKEKKVFRLILVVGSGVGDGLYTNQAWAAAASGTLLSRIAQATVRIVPDPTFDCPDIIGKVFDDQNANGYQDEGEPGIPAVRVVTPRGLLVMTDSEGRFHVPCPDIPNEDRGSNFVMKLDTRTLPTGYRLTTENPRDVRITRGKVSKLNFGATIHRVIRLELSDAAFETSKTTLLPQWQKQLDALPQQIKSRPSVVRLAYQPGSDDGALVGKRIAAVSRQIQDRWHTLKGAYALAVETEGVQ